MTQILSVMVVPLIIKGNQRVCSNYVASLSLVSLPPPPWAHPYRELLWACSTERSPGEDPGHAGKITSQLAREHLGVFQEKPKEVAVERNFWASLLKLLS